MEAAQSDMAKSGGWKITEGYHTKKEHDMYSVSPDGFREGDWGALKSELTPKAKALGGWYANRWGKTPSGWHFKDRESAEKFQGLVSGETESVDASEQLTAKEQERAGTVSGRLRNMADKLHDTSTEADNAERRENTARQAGMAASARATARAGIAKAATMHRIADAIEAGDAEMLSGVSTKSHVDELDSQLRRSKWDWYHAKQKEHRDAGGDHWNTPEELRHDNFEGREPDDETIDHTEFPYPSIQSGILNDAIASLKGKRNIKWDVQALKNAQARAGKDATSVKFSSETEWGALKNVIAKLKQYKNPEYQRTVDHLNERSASFKRLHAMGITNGHELRESLRQYNGVKEAKGQEDPVRKAERSLIGKKIPGFFPTPVNHVDDMIDHADIKPGMDVLEPSAGKGDILDRLALASPESNVHGLELDRTFSDVLSAKGHNVEFGDFMDHKGEYDRVVMNPPFEKRQDAEHVMHAHSLLKSGGRLVAIVGNGSLQSSDKKAKAFQDFIDEHGGEIHEMPAGSFAGNDAFRKTGVNTSIVVVDKS